MKKLLLLFLCLTITHKALTADDFNSTNFENMTSEEQSNFLEKERTALLEERKKIISNMTLIVNKLTTEKEDAFKKKKPKKDPPATKFKTILKNPDYKELNHFNNYNDFKINSIKTDKSICKLIQEFEARKDFLTIEEQISFLLTQYFSYTNNTPEARQKQLLLIQSIINAIDTAGITNKEKMHHLKQTQNATPNVFEKALIQEEINTIDIFCFFDGKKCSQKMRL